MGTRGQRFGVASIGVLHNAGRCLAAGVISWVEWKPGTNLTALDLRIG